MNLSNKSTIIIFQALLLVSLAVLACSAEEEVAEKKTAKRGIYGLGYGSGYGYGHYPYYSYSHYPVVSKVYTSGHYTGLGHYGGYYGGLGHGYYGGHGYYPYHDFGHHGLYGHGYGWW